MFTGIVPRGLSFTKIIGGISKTLQVANQIIPLYQRAVPMINNARTAFHVLKEFSKSDKNEQKSIPQNNNNSNIKNSQNRINTVKKEGTSSLTFFL